MKDKEDASYTQKSRSIEIDLEDYLNYLNLYTQIKF